MVYRGGMRRWSGHWPSYRPGVAMRSVHILGLLACLSIVCPVAQATSFRCTKAITWVEKAICSTPQLAKLDDLLSSAYKKALVTTPDPKAFKIRQRAWLKVERDA